jgi:PTH1 family peptidyl-tRNA hydrolase
MNLSGQAVSLLLAYFKLSPEHLVVIHDDLDVPQWRLKIVERGGAGGHRGVASIISHLHTEEFLRVKLGIGRPSPEMPTGRLQPSHFPVAAAENVARLIERAAQVDILVGKVNAAQNSFHGINDLVEQGEKGKREKG